MRLNPKDSAECLAAREALDLARDGEPATPRVDAARAHVASCSSCEAAVSAARRFDARIARALAEVRVPDGLHDRLRRALGLPEASLAPCASPAGPELSIPEARRRRWSRRRWLSAAMAVGTCASLTGWLAWQWRRPNESVEELLALVAGELPDPGTLTEVNRLRGAPELLLPRTMLAYAVIDGLPRQLPGHDAAVWFFTLPARRGRVLQGRLAVAPASRVADRPLATQFLGGQTVYLGGFCLTAWVEADLVYVAALAGSENELRRLALPDPVAV